MQIELRRRRLDLTIRADGPTAPTVFADRTLLAQALLNLLWNAMQATPAGGRISVSARRWHTAGHPRTAIAIADSGIGIAPAIRGQLFTPFFTTKTTGTGLGLVSCRRIAKELGGNLGLYPRRRGGARAVLVLPALATVVETAEALA